MKHVYVVFKLDAFRNDVDDHVGSVEGVFATLASAQHFCLYRFSISPNEWETLGGDAGVQSWFTPSVDIETWPVIQ